MYPRFVEHSIQEALLDTRVVLIVGPRQSGKTTLAKRFERDGMSFVTLDNATTLAAAESDPVGFVRPLDRAVIDEVQRAPGLLLAIKESVDADRRPGRFLLTGSSDLMTLPRVADSLAGRMEIVRLLPLAQCEIRGHASRFLERAFWGEPQTITSGLVGADLMEAVLAGGYPEAMHRRSWARRQRWYLGYIDSIIERDVRDVAQIEHLHQIPRLLRVLAQHAGQLINFTAAGASVGLTHVTTQKYVGVLEKLFLTRTLPPWYTNQLKRLTKTPKLHFLDSGLLAALRDLSPERLRADRTAFGPLLETFVLTELLKLTSWAGGRFELSHFRDKDGNEVDVVMEDQQDRTVGVEVKAAATVTASDFSGLRRLAEARGERFACGLVLYDHDKVVPFGERLFAAPVSCLWE